MNNNKDDQKICNRQNADVDDKWNHGRQEWKGNNNNNNTNNNDDNNNNSNSNNNNNNNNNQEG